MLRGGGRKLEVWYDGQCPACVAARDWAARRDSSRKLIFCDIHDEALAPVRPRPKEELAEQLAVVEEDGHLRFGFHAWRSVLGALGAWRVLGAVAGVPPVRWVGPVVYRFVARRRDRIAVGAGRSPESGH